MILSSVIILLNIIFRRWEILVYFLSHGPETNLFSHHLSQCNFILNLTFSAFLYISHQIIFMMYDNVRNFH